MTGLHVLKGHGTENDFVLVPDLDASLSLSASLVRALCDRHAGIGADGVLRVVRTKLATEPDVLVQVDQGAEFFMDYRNADGSIAEMCGNGVRVFARYLQRAGLIDVAAVVATRGGPRPVSLDGTAVTVGMGIPVIRPERPVVAGRWTGAALELPNPHVVVELTTTQELDELDLSVPPTVEPALPDGQNVEFFVRTGPNQVQLRVHERGVGETRSCGTGICAVAVVAAGGQLTEAWQVDVPGGRCTVGAVEGQLTLSGPAVLVADIELDLDWVHAHR